MHRLICQNLSDKNYNEHSARRHKVPKTGEETKTKNKSNGEENRKEHTHIIVLNVMD